MTSLRPWLCLLLLTACTTTAGTGAGPSARPGLGGPDAQARALLDLLAQGKFEEAVATFDPTMTTQLPPPRLAQVWQGLVAQHGAFGGVETAQVEPRGDLRRVVARSRFGGGHLDALVTYDASDRVAGLFFRPVDDLAAKGKREAQARQLVAHLAEGQQAQAVRSFSSQMAAALPAERLGELWQQLQGQLGPFQKVLAVKEEPTGGYFVQLTACQFEKGTATLKVVLDPQGQVAGLFVVPGDLTGAWTPPPYANPAVVEEREVKVGTSPALPGHLTLPKYPGPFPAVVLVHGSGPNDEDETVGPNKIFKDLALGLASRGIAVLRYQKRTRVAPEGVVTVKEEVLDGVKDALALLAAQPEVDRRRLVVLGHSLGGYLGPWIAMENPQLAGLVLLAGSARPVLDLLVEQLEYFTRLRPDDPQAQQALADARAQRDRSLAPDLTSEEELFHATGAYYLALRTYQPVDLARTQQVPTLILQGERDYQVTPAGDYAAWQAGLKDRKDVTFKLYPKLNHLFIEGEGTPSPADYERPGHLSQEVVEDLARWISALPPHEEQAPPPPPPAP